MFGVQVEAAAFATSYIPTAATTVTRAADVCVINTSSIPTYSATAGTFVASFDTAQSNSSVPPRVIGASPSSYAPISLPGPLPVFSAYDGTNVQTSTGITLKVTQKAATAFTGTAISISLNGAAVISGTGSVGFGGLTKLGFGIDATASANFLNGHIQSFAYYNYALTNTQLIVITGGVVPSGSTFTVLAANGTSYTTPYSNVLSSAGTSYTVAAAVLSSNGSSYNPI
jgi:hypothetical protein